MAQRSIQFENRISKAVIGKCIKIHKALGPGFLESTYKHCLNYELIQDGYFVELEKPMPIIYEEVKLDHGYRMDFLVNQKVVVELKAVDALNQIHLAQILTYLRLGNYKLGLLINFNVPILKDGIKRVIL